MNNLHPTMEIILVIWTLLTIVWWYIPDCGRDLYHRYLCLKRGLEKNADGNDELSLYHKEILDKGRREEMNVIKVMVVLEVIFVPFALLAAARRKILKSVKIG